jgi:hypothetical protein
VADAAPPALLLVATGVAVPVAAAVGLLFVRVASPWSAVAAVHRMTVPPPANAHRVSGQTIRVGPRYSVFSLVRVFVSRDTLWLTFAGPAGWLFAPVMIPLDALRLHTSEDWLARGARLELLQVPGVSITLRGDGAQLVIARLG